MVPLGQFSSICLNSNANYPVDIYLDTVKLSGMTAPGVAIGKARSDILIAKEASGLVW